jgi:thioredoxin-related protein
MVNLTAKAQEKINWMSLEQAISKTTKQPKKIFMDMYTDWCGWCKKMDQTTFADPVIVAYMNKHYYAVKFNAEGQDSVVFNKQVYVQQKPGQKRSPHNLAILLLNGKMSYPSYVFLNPDQSVITAVPGYYAPDQFEPLLHFLTTDAWKTTKWPDFQKGFVGKVKK